ncbi:MAG: glycosyltransferase family 4 protein, partial [Armatimonadetes bacterium]|nr:glycosyltransferase family 4 protein [Armatimonadota bacterium]
VIEHLGVRPERTKLAPLGVSGHFRPVEPEQVRAVVERHGLSERYLLCVGNIEPRKNLPGIIAAFEAVADRIPHELVIAGRRGWRCGPSLRAMKSSPVARRIRWLGYVSEEELPALYAGADALVQWSLYEGFGLTPLEAMACGTATVVSDGGALPEVVGEAAAVAPLAAGPAGLAEMLVAVIEDDDMHATLIERGRARAARFTWRGHARLVAEAYREAFGEQARP